MGARAPDLMRLRELKRVTLKVTGEYILQLLGYTLDIRVVSNIIFLLTRLAQYH